MRIIETIIAILSPILILLSPQLFAEGMDGFVGGKQ